MCILSTAKGLARRGQAPMHHGRTALLALLLAGCGPVERFYDSKLTPDTPVEWWQGLQGGRIAAARPPPPGVADPYPNLADVPARPVLPDAATRRALQARLTAERDLTRRDGERDPIGTVPAVRAAAPVAAARPTPDPEASMAVFDAATAPPARALAPSAPVAPAPAPVAVAVAAPAGVVPARPESGPLPELPGAAPAVPRLGGLPAGALGPAAPRPAPSVVVTFPRGSATLNDEAAASLRSLAQRRAGGSVLVSAHGDAAPNAASGLTLALRRARSIAGGLTEAGVPSGALRYDVVALGRGSGAQIVDP